jgi:hypothetical protein
MSHNGATSSVDLSEATLRQDSVGGGGVVTPPTNPLLGDVLKRLQCLTPNGPIGSTQGVRAVAPQRGVWAVDELEGGKLRISIPRNLEAFADDFQAIAAANAIALLGDVELVESTVDWPLNQRLNEAQRAPAQYFGGIAHALRDLPTQPCQDYSGSFGHGYYWVGHLNLEASNVQGWLIKGTVKTPAQALTQSAWGTGMPQELRRLEALLRRGARALDLSKQAHSWCRTRQQLVGHGIRTGLPWKSTGVLTQSESLWMSNAYRNAEQAYNNMLDSLEPANVNLNVMRDLPRRNQEVSRLLREPSTMADQAVRGRFVALTTGLTRRDAQREQRRPIEDRVRDTGIETKLEVFHPLFLRGRRFRLPQELLEGIHDSQEAKANAFAQAEAFCNAERDPELRDLAKTWFASVINAG